jgi:hypothetical protein
MTTVNKNISVKPTNLKPNSLNNNVNKNRPTKNSSVLRLNPNVKNTKSKTTESFSDYNTDNTLCNETIKRNIENGGIICEDKLRKTINRTILHRTFDIRNPTYLVEPMYFDFNLQNKQMCFKSNSNSKQLLTNHPFLDVGYEKIN